MTAPDDRRYLQTHEWALLDGSCVTVGITKFAADELTDVTYVDLPSVGASVVAGDSFGEIESVKAASELYSPVSGAVVEINQRLEDSPELVNEDPFGEGWMIRIEVSDPASLGNLMDEAEYEKHTAR
jgi:glycine cleavage system H protein